MICEDSDQVEADPTRSLHGRRTPELGKGSKGQHSVAEAAISDPPSRCQRSVERTLTRADLAERHKGVGEHELGVREPRVVIVGAQHPCRSPRAVGDRAERLGGSQRREPSVEHVGDRRFVLGCRRRNEVGDNNRGFIGVATGDQRVAAIARERTPAKVFGGQQGQGSTQQRRRARHVVAIERPVRRRRQVRCRSLGQTTRPVAVALPELDSELVRLLQVVSQRFVVLDSRRADVGDQPLGVALVQIGAHLFEDSPIRRVTDERMVEAEHPVVGPPRPLRIDQLAAAQRVEMRVEIGTDLGRHELEQRAPGRSVDR